MTRRAWVIVIASAGAAIFLVAAFFGIRSYLDAVKTAAPPSPNSEVVNAATKSAYHQAISSWPFALPPGEAFPQTPPGHLVVGQDSARPFVSFFFLCAWEHQYLEGPASEQGIAVRNLWQWELLPASMSSADNSDNVWNADVLVPAIRGDTQAMKGLYAADCHGESYEGSVTTPGNGVTMDRPQLAAVSTLSILDPCASYPGGVPCDPAYGPNRTVDLGSREGARGTVTLDGAGVPRSYLVARGDTASAIADRFGGANIWSLNCYRRTDLNIYAGDILNLDKYTVATNGSENGASASKNPRAAADCLTQSSVPPGQVTP